MKNVICKICGNNVHRIIDGQYNLNYNYCSHCQFIFLDEKQIVSQKEELEEYMLHENSFEDEGYINMFKRFIQMSIEPYKMGMTKALDFGCGPVPVLAKLLKEEGFEVDIYDPYFAPERVFERKKYDLITSTEVFEHLKNPIETMKLLKPRLKENGILAVMTLFHPNDEEGFKKWWYRREATHISFYTPRTFKYLADKFRMKVLKVDNKNICVLQNRQDII